jgi:succinate dehydrogenase / fumarate reductase flavoprotein subunit
MAQGGINAVLSGEDSIQKHIEDTFNAGGKLADKEAVRILCEHAPETIAWLDRLGVPFSKCDNGAFLQRKLGGAKYPRACYSQDYTGLKLLHTLNDYALHAGCNFLNEHFLLDLLVEENSCHGALFWDIKRGAEVTVYAKNTVLAGGGFAKIFGPYSTNSTAQNGDIVAIAHNNGVKLSNMEFIQFHPTALKNSSILISESARGAGGKLINSKGERFVDELQPRDVVSRATYQQIEKGESVFLDITHLGAAFVEENLPQERKLALLYEKVDPLTDPIPIKPAAHYSMGGISTDTKAQTSINALYAAGECADTGLHGANRLGGNSLLELIVFGRIAGKNAALSCTDTRHKTLTKTITLPFEGETLNFYPWRHELSEQLYQDASIVKDPAKLAKLLASIRSMKKRIAQVAINDKNLAYNTELIDLLEFKNALTVAELYVESALKRKESIGAHYVG